MCFLLENEINAMIMIVYFPVLQNGFVSLLDLEQRPQLPTAYQQYGEDLTRAIAADQTGVDRL
jgi:hypothetical protein